MKCLQSVEIWKCSHYVRVQNRKGAPSQIPETEIDVPLVRDGTGWRVTQNAFNVKLKGSPLQNITKNCFKIVWKMF
jgi:hypothetical protein